MFLCVIVCKGEPTWIILYHQTISAGKVYIDKNCIKNKKSNIKCCRYKHLPVSLSCRYCENSSNLKNILQIIRHYKAMQFDSY